MFHRRHVTLSAQIYNGWSVQIKAPADVALGFMAETVALVTKPKPAPPTPVDEPANVVGFHGTADKAPTPRRPVVRAGFRGSV